MLVSFWCIFMDGWLLWQFGKFLKVYHQSWFFTTVWPIQNEPRCEESTYLSSLCSLSSSSWTLFSSRLIPTVGRVCPSISATRDLSSFSWYQNVNKLHILQKIQDHLDCVQMCVRLNSLGKWQVSYLSLKSALIHFKVMSCWTLLHQLWTKLVHLRGAKQEKKTKRQIEWSWF